MDEILDALKENATKFGNMDGGTPETIDAELAAVDFGQVESSLSNVVDAVTTVQQEIRRSERDDAYADGLDDGVGVVESNLDLAAGQLGVTTRVIKAGAGPRKAAEYIENAADAVGEAKRNLDSMNDFVSDHAEDPSQVNNAVDTAMERLTELEEALNRANDDLK